MKWHTIDHPLPAIAPYADLQFFAESLSWFLTGVPCSRKYGYFDKFLLDLKIISAKHNVPNLPCARSLGLYFYATPMSSQTVQSSLACGWTAAQNALSKCLSIKGLKVCRCGFGDFGLGIAGCCACGLAFGCGLPLGVCVAMLVAKFYGMPQS